MPEPTNPNIVRRRFQELAGQRNAFLAQRARRQARLAELTEFLAIAPQVEQALEQLGRELFGKLVELIETNLTYALQDILGQPIRLRVKQEYKRGGATLDLYIERDGQEEDIMRGTGGSVTNILSVGLRLFALSRLDPAKHRRFLLLDEHDCWLAPDLVPKLVKVIHEAGKALGFQVIMISHHDPSSFDRYADRIYRFAPSEDGVKVEIVDAAPSERDSID